MKEGKKMIDMKELVAGRFYTRMDDLVNDLKDGGYAVEDTHGEYVTAWGEEDGEDVFYTLELNWGCGSFTVGKIRKEVV